MDKYPALNRIHTNSSSHALTKKDLNEVEVELQDALVAARRRLQLLKSELATVESAASAVREIKQEREEPKVTHLTEGDIFEKSDRSPKTSLDQTSAEAPEGARKCQRRSNVNKKRGQLHPEVSLTVDATFNQSLVQSMEKQEIPHSTNEVLDKLWPEGHESLLANQPRKLSESRGVRSSTNTKQSISDALRLKSIRANFRSRITTPGGDMLELDEALKKSLNSFVKSKWLVNDPPKDGPMAKVVKRKESEASKLLKVNANLLSSPTTELVWSEAERLDTENTMAELEIINCRIVQHVHDKELVSGAEDFDKLVAGRNKRLQTLKNKQPDFVER